ncbi:SpoIIAA family protein [Chryseobacterium lacus]|uniref:STAS/SEC14 domain-containing protein n=1 Tax=Chryseobacterium lacus TaxID=2058346 RepID=UPI00086C630F|nr:STAS/SEC14 domain-containing protein [Chryseobacterium lacus]ODS88680.1 MAG: hypothetical protein ABS44_08220 [Chryseobacterium sp. SCN 40-13]RST29187.1 STAS/SEC14 domain-containing protein [Chryseobacterium lacus]
MVKRIINLPESVLGFKFSRISRNDFAQEILPEVSQKTEKNPKLHFMYVIENDPEGDFGVWFEDAIRRVQKRCCWNKTAFITDCDRLSTHVKNFQKFMIGDYKIFKKSEEQDAITWLMN